MTHLPTEGHVLDWLVEKDPALRWQVERYLPDAPASTWQGTRARVAEEGFGRRLLDAQDAVTGDVGRRRVPSRRTPRSTTPVTMNRSRETRRRGR